MGLGKSKQSAAGRSGYSQQGNSKNNYYFDSSHYHRTNSGMQKRVPPANGFMVHNQSQYKQQHNPVRQTVQKPVHNPARDVQHMHQHKQLQQHPQILKQRNKNTKECFVCGHEGHSGLRCHHRNMTCHICNQPGHLASVCKQTYHHADSVYKPKPRQPYKQRTTKR